MESTIELTPDYLDLLVQMDRFQELGLYANIFRFGIPLLWFLTLVLLWRISGEVCTYRVTKQYQIMTILLLLFSSMFYGFSFMSFSIVRVLVLLIISFLLTARVTYSNINKYRKEYME